MISNNLKPGMRIRDTEEINRTTTILRFIEMKDGFYYFKYVSGLNKYPYSNAGLIILTNISQFYENI